MKKTKIKQRFENAFNAFFDNESFAENDLTVFDDGNAELFRESVAEDVTVRANVLINVLKQAFLFLPGTFILFIISFAITAVSINNPFNAAIPNNRIPQMIFWFLAAIFMTWFGFGDRRKPKHLIIPLSIIVTGIASGALSSIISMLSLQLQHLVWNNSYPLYLFPLALIAPVLAKGWIDKEEVPTS